MQEFSDVVIMFSSGNQLDTIAIDWMHSDKFREGRTALHQVDENQKFKLIISWSKTSKSVGLNIDTGIKVFWSQHYPILACLVEHNVFKVLTSLIICFQFSLIVIVQDIPDLNSQFSPADSAARPSRLISMCLKVEEFLLLSDTPIHQAAKPLKLDAANFLALCLTRNSVVLKEDMLVYGELPPSATGCPSPFAIHPPPKPVDGHGFGTTELVQASGVSIKFGAKLYFFTTEEVLERFELYHLSCDEGSEERSGTAGDGTSSTGANLNTAETT